MSLNFNVSKQQSICTYVINMVASVINGIMPPENTENLKWTDIIEFAKAQCVLNIIAYASEKLKNKPEPQTMKYLREFKNQKIIIEAQQQLEADDAMDKLSLMKIRHMPLKGYIVKNLYPSPDMRTMGDIDILIDADRCEEAVAAFRSDGFSFCGEGELHSNVERGNAYIELHHSMVDEHYTKLNSYFGDGFKRARLCDGYKYRYELSDEDLYIFLIAHIAKHYRNAGTGIRTLLDLYVYRRAYPDLDTKYISAEMKKTGLEKFHNKMEHIADSWFSGSFDGEYDAVSSYIVSGGIYGLKENTMLNEFIHNNANSLEDEKSRHLVRDFFPEYKVMSIRYPVLKKCKWLLPVFWVIRVFDTLINEPKNAKGRIIDSVDIIKIDQKMIDAQHDVEIDEL